MISRVVVCALCAFALSACSGVRTTDNAYSAHAENLNILFMKIPGGDTQERAMKLVPEGAKVVSMSSTPDDLTSVFGVFNRFLGVDFTVIDGEIEK